MNLIMLGAPGAGKGTQAVRIKEKFDIPHISTGDIFRANIKNGTELGNKAKAYMDKGELVPDELVCDLVVSRLKENDCEKGFILDGFPRTLGQADSLDKALDSFGKKIDYAIDIEVPDSAIVKRMSGRRLCESCGAGYSIFINPPKVEGVCDKCGGKVIQRDDDKEETVLNRLNVYHEQTQPLIDYYKDKGCLKEIDGTKMPDEIFEAIVKIVEG